MGFLEPVSAPDIAPAIRLMLERGYEATTAGDLADVLEMSRSTFFRRFGSKDDVVFADHEAVLVSIQPILESTRGNPLKAIVAACHVVLTHSTADAETARDKYELLHQVPALRNREIVASNRYERAFSSYLRRRLPDSDYREYGSLAFSAGAVSTHNAVVRRWLRGEVSDPNRVMTEQLDTLINVFRGVLLDDEDGLPGGVLVARFAPGSTEQDILRALRQSLRSTNEEGAEAVEIASERAEPRPIRPLSLDY